MAIERLSFPKYLGLKYGIPLGDSGGAQNRVVEVISHYYSQVHVLPEGEYDLTPEVWTVNGHTHLLLVQAAGTGVYRQIPKYSDTGSIMFDTVGTITLADLKSGGRLMQIPGEMSIGVVAGGSPRHEDVRLYEVFYHTPGRSPLEEIVGSRVR